MKITRAEAEALESMLEHAPALHRLGKLVEKSTLTRRALAYEFALAALARAGGDEAAAREAIFRCVTVCEAVHEGEPLQVEQLERLEKLQSGGPASAKPRISARADASARGTTPAVQSSAGESPGAQAPTKRGRGGMLQ